MLRWQFTSLNDLVCRALSSKIASAKTAINAPIMTTAGYPNPVSIAGTPMTFAMVNPMNIMAAAHGGPHIYIGGLYQPWCHDF